MWNVASAEAKMWCYEFSTNTWISVGKFHDEITCTKNVSTVLIQYGFIMHDGAGVFFFLFGVSYLILSA